MLRLAKGVKNIIRRVVEILCVALLAAVVGLVLMSIVFRNIGVQFVGVYELTRILFIWATFFGIAIGFERRAHIAIDSVYWLFPSWFERLAGVVIPIVALAFFSAIAYFGFDLLPSVARQRMPSSGLSAQWLYLPIPITSAVMALSAMFQLVEQIATLGGKRGTSGPVASAVVDRERRGDEP